MTSRLKTKRLRAPSASKSPREKQRKSDVRRASLLEPVANQLTSGASQTNRPMGRWRLIIGAVWLVIAVWSYWPLMLELAATWQREPDYSHGFLVVPIALFFLWIRRESFPGFVDSSPLVGMVLLGTGIALRFAG